MSSFIAITRTEYRSATGPIRTRKVSMKAKSKDVAVERGDEIEQLRTSPIREIPPISNNPIEILIDKIEIDPTNPGADEVKSLRYKRRAGSIRDSVDIIGSVVYPIVVCQKPNDPTRYIHV